MDCIMPLCSYVIARSDGVCRAVAIPRKGSSRLRLLGAMTHYGQLGNIAPKHSSTLKEYPHSAATPTAHPGAWTRATKFA